MSDDNIILCRNINNPLYKDVCEEEVDHDDYERKELDPYSNECTACCIHREQVLGDKHIAYLGVQSASGKMANITILSFEDERNRSQYKKTWDQHSNSGYNIAMRNVGKAGSFDRIKYKTVHENFANVNHKGKQ